VLTAFDLVGPDQPQLRHQIRDDLLAMGDFLVKYQWTAPRANGVVGTNNQDDIFIAPLLNASLIGRLSVAAAVRHVVDVDGSPADQQRWDAIWASEITHQGPLVGVQAQFDPTNKHMRGRLRASHQPCRLRSPERFTRSKIGVSPEEGGAHTTPTGRHIHGARYSESPDCHGHH
jgi:hypothetical protein